MYRPNWIDSRIYKNHLDDETDFLQYGQSDDQEFTNYEINKDPKPSAWSEFPTTENPYNKYKFSSL